ncbi:MAG TPA: zf-HC2 domain-containing protein [Anaerolineales bacterium]|nr:zf-HC2 domain-containing protein [Anaerolineales bacterium]
MNHQLFEDWLFSEDPLSPDQVQALEDHLKTCDSCRQLSVAWSEVETLFVSAPPAMPAAGFTARWKAHWRFQLADKNHKRQQKQTWAIFGVTTLGTILLFMLMFGQFRSAIDTPTDLFLFWVTWMTSLLSYANAVQDVSLTLLRTLLSVLPLSYWVVSLSALCALSLLWIFSLRHFYFRGGLFNEADD